MESGGCHNWRSHCHRFDQFVSQTIDRWFERDVWGLCQGGYHNLVDLHGFKLQQLSVLVNRILEAHSVSISSSQEQIIIVHPTSDIFIGHGDECHSFSFKCNMSFINNRVNRNYIGGKSTYPPPREAQCCHPSADDFFCNVQILRIMIAVHFIGCCIFRRRQYNIIIRTGMVGS